MNRKLSYLADLGGEVKTVADFLKDKGYSSRLITYIKKTDGGLTIEGKQVFTNYKLSEGDRLKVNIVEEKSSENIVATKMKVDIVYEDEDLIIINKDCNLPIHPSQGNFDNTLANGMVNIFKERGENFVYRCINRLDRDTTGLLILAKNILSASILSDMVGKRLIEREYRALVKGAINEEGFIDGPIARVEGSTIERCVNHHSGAFAVTHYKRIECRNDYSFVSLKLETGRTHQIRVHMNSIGHTLLGDTLYGGEIDQIGRQALHSYRLSFLHPINKRYMEFTCEVPEDMASILKG